MNASRAVATLECRDVVKSFRGRRAVDAVSLTIGAGICVLLGANGAGKSTLLRLMSGLDAPDSGAVEVAGFDVAKREVMLKQSIGVLPDQLGLFETLTIAENLDCVGQVYGLGSSEIDARSASLLRLLDLLNGRNTLAANGSYGMRKKTALAMALLHNPQVLLLDEPFEGIDPASTRVMERMFTDLASRGTTVVMTSHILPLVERLATRTILLRAGTIAWDSDQEQPETSLEQMYFRLVGEPPWEMPPWLG